MEQLLIYIGKTSIYLLIFILVYNLFLRRTTFFHFNRFYLLGGLILSFILPLYQYTYDVYLPVITSPLSAHSTIINASAETHTSPINILFIVYLVGVFILLSKLVFNSIKFYKILKNKTILKQDKYKIIDDNDIKAPFTVKNYIFFNGNKLTLVEKELILNHEKAHIDQYHWIDLIFCELAIILQWFNPIVWQYIKIQKENHEFLADQAVIDMNISPATYRAVLINQQFQNSIFTFSNSFNITKPINRLKMITKSKSSPWKKVAAVAILPFIGIFIWASAKPNYVFVNETNQVDNITTEITPDTVTKKRNYLALSAKASEEPLFIIDGKITPYKDYADLNSDKEYRTVIMNKESAIKTYGDKAKNGAIVVTSKLQTIQDTSRISVITAGAVSNIGVRGMKFEEGKEPLTLIDGVEKTNNDLEKLKPEEIYSVSVLKDASATKLYGNKAKNGVILITTKSAADQNNKTIIEKLEEGKFETRNSSISPLVIVDNIEKPNSYLKNLSPDKIESVTVLKDESAIKVYGEKGKNGVVIVELKTK